MKLYTFASFVGKQTTGVINAIKACLSKENINYPIDRIVLYATSNDLLEDGGISEGTINLAQIIKNQCLDIGFHSVEIIEINRKEDRSEELIKKEIENGRDILFYAEGGMNFSVSFYMASLSNISRSAVILLSNGSHYCTVQLEDCKNKLYYDDVVLPFSEKRSEEILDEQLVSYKILENDTPLANYIKTYIPKDSLRYSPLFSTEIDGLPFDMVWNCGGNHLAMLCATANIGKGKSTYLKGARAYSSFAAGKSNNKGLFDCKVYIQCIKRSLKEQVKHESKGKAVPLNTIGFFDDVLFFKDIDAEFGSVRNKDLENELIKIFSNKYVSEELKEDLLKKVSVSSSTFITVMGKDSTPTTKVIESHFRQFSFSTVILLTTSDLEYKCNKLINKLESLNRFKNVVFRIVKTDLRGRSIPYRLTLEAGAKNVTVNITPGTKGQTAFLTLFAVENRCNIFALVNDKVIPITKNSGNAFDVCSFDPIEIFCTEKNKVKYKTYKSVSLKLKDHYKNLLKSIKSAFDNESNTDCFKFELEKSGYKIKSTENDGIKVENFSLGIDKKLGDWFEDFVAAAFSQLRESVVHENVTYCRESMKGHITEIDCLVSVDHMVVAVSCKALYESKIENQVDCYKKALKEVISYARSINRLCIPVLCCIDKLHLKDVEKVGEAKIPVGILSLKDLCDPNRIKNILEKVEKKYRYGYDVSSE